MLGDFFVSVNPDDQVIPQSFGLTEGIGVTKMNHVVAENDLNHFYFHSFLNSFLVQFRSSSNSN